MSTLAGTIFSALAGLLTANGAAWAQSGARSGRRGWRYLARPGFAARSHAQQRLLGATDGQYRKFASREHLTIIGTEYMPGLETVSGKGCAGRADGLRLGPNAQVTVRGEKGFGGGVAIRSNSIVQDLRADLGLVRFDRINEENCRTP